MKQFDVHSIQFAAPARDAFAFIAVRTIFPLLVLVNSEPCFSEQHLVANGASELCAEVLGDREPKRWACCYRTTPYSGSIPSPTMAPSRSPGGPKMTPPVNAPVRAQLVRQQSAFR